jgi:hypothetical protein
MTLRVAGFLHGGIRNGLETNPDGRKFLWAWKFFSMGMEISLHGHGSFFAWAWKFSSIAVEILPHCHANFFAWAGVRNLDLFRLPRSLHPRIRILQRRIYILHSRICLLKQNLPAL